MLSRSADGCARRSDGGGLDLAGGWADHEGVMRGQLCASMVQPCTSAYDNVQHCTSFKKSVTAVCNIVRKS